MTGTMAEGADVGLEGLRLDCKGLYLIYVE